MARHLYIFAVLSIEAASEVEERLKAIDDKDRIAVIMQHVGQLLDKSQPHVAFYRAVLDGWNRAHDRCLEQWTDDDVYSPLLRELNQRGVLWLSSTTVAIIEPLRVETFSAGELNDYATAAFAQGFNDCLQFIRATGCPGLLLCRCLGPSFDDAEFTRD